ncbi:MAG: proline racemase family protein, partial [Alphaproteobacteria bacterium]
EIAGRAAILPRVEGRGWIHGIHQIGLDPTDPYPLGFKVSDCWGDAFDLLK